MNDSTISMLRAVLKIGAGYFVAKGVMTDEQGETIAAGIVGLLAVVWGVLHRSGPGANPPAAGKLAALLAVAVSIGVLSTGCANVADNAFRAEMAAATVSDAGMRSYGQYWQAAIQNPAAFHTTTNELWATRQKVSGMSVKIGSGIELTESLRASYATNSAVEPQLQAAVSALAENTAQIVPFITGFLTVTNGAK